MQSKSKWIYRIVSIVLAIILIVSCGYSFIYKEGLWYRLFHPIYHIADVWNNIGMKDKLDESENLPESAMSWTRENDYVAHGCGEIEGYTVTNTREAFLSSYGKGARVFEVDLEITSDGKVVCTHDWGMFSEETGVVGVPSLAEFKDAKVYEKYHTLDIVALFDLLNTHKDAWVIFDKIDSNERADMMIPGIIEAAEQFPDVLDQCSVQFFDIDSYEHIDGLHHFEHYVYTSYRHATYDFEYMGVFCLDKGIEAMVINDDYVTDEQITEMAAKGVKVYVFTVNTRQRAEEIIGRGGGVYTDFLG